MAGRSASNRTSREDRGRLTELELAVQARYDACLAAGGHIDSGAVVVREFAGVGRHLPICAVCEVPYHRNSPQRWGQDISRPQVRRRRRKG